MVCIVEFKTKKELKDTVKNIDKKEDMDFFIKDPSIINPQCFLATDLKLGEKVRVTNHPKRSWFATIERTNKGLIVK